jgi:signal transduction histidine kinase
MKNFYNIILKANRILLLLLWFLSLSWSTIAVYTLSNKPNLNLPLCHSDSYFFVYSKSQYFNLNKGDILISLDDDLIKSEKDYLYKIDKKRIGGKIIFEFERNGIRAKNDFILKPYKRWFYSGIILISSITFLILSLIVYLSKPEEKKVKILFLFSILFIFDAVGSYFPYLKLSYPHSPLYPYYLILIFLIPPCLLYFFSFFPQELPFKNIRFFTKLFFILSPFLALLFIFLFLKTNIFCKENMHLIPFWYLFIWLVIFPVLISIYHIFKSKEEKETIQAKWVLYSFILAGFLHILIRLVPFLTENKIFIDKSFLIMIDLLFPLSIILSIKKHNLFNIDRLFYKTILYFLSIISFIFLYIFIARIITIFFESSMEMPQIISVFISIIILYPFFNFSKNFLNKIFLRTESKTIEKIEKFGNEIMNLHTIEQIKEKIKIELKDILKVAYVEFDLNNLHKRNNATLFYKLNGERWNAFLSIGEKLSEQKFTQIEKKALQNLAIQIQKSIDYCFLRQELIEKEKLAMIGKVSSIIAHEIKNPLNAMKLIVVFLIQKYGETEEYRIILNEIERLNKILNDVQDWSKTISLCKKEFRIYQFIEHLEKIILPILKEKDIQFIIEKPQENFSLNADFERLEQVMLNLVQNSITAIRDRKGEVKFKAFTEEHRCYFHFEDNGIGMDDKEVEKIFEPFSSSTGSSGIGLYVVKKIIDAHKGQIYVYSEKNKGTRFVLWIPC